MKSTNYLLIALIAIVITNLGYAQSLDKPFSKKKMKKDLQIFREIRDKANSGVYKYRTKSEIDAIYEWAYEEIEKSESYGDFYNIISYITDYEGSLHNDSYLPKKVMKKLRNEEEGYFPYPIKQVNGKMRFNFETKEIPLGAELISINGENMENIIPNLYQYYTTDGLNETGKFIGINYSFGKYYRLLYGASAWFEVVYKVQNLDVVKKVKLKSVGYKTYYENVEKRYSKVYDKGLYKSWKIDEMYNYKSLDDKTGILTIHSFSMGNEVSNEHKEYISFLDSVFIHLKEKGIQNLIVDVRNNGGGTDPNDLVTYSYLTNRTFSENVEAWISFNKIPSLKYIDTWVPVFLRPLGIGKYNKYFQEQFPVEKNGRFYQNEKSDDHKIRSPHKNRFEGNIYMLVGSRIASAGSLFAAMLASDEKTIVIGEETMGGYYGHNGHTSLSYILPKSKIEISFSIVNLEQDVEEKEYISYGRGILPDYEVLQRYDDFINHRDVQMQFVLDFISKEGE